MSVTAYLRRHGNAQPRTGSVVASRSLGRSRLSAAGQIILPNDSDRRKLTSALFFVTGRSTLELDLRRHSLAVKRIRTTRRAKRLRNGPSAPGGIGSHLCASRTSRLGRRTLISQLRALLRPKAKELDRFGLGFEQMSGSISRGQRRAELHPHEGAGRIACRGAVVLSMQFFNRREV